MKNLVCEESHGLGRAASSWCQDKIQQHRARSIFVPAGKTPVALYEVWEKKLPSYLKGIDLIQIDDVLTGPSQGVFKSFLIEHLPSYQQQIRFIDGASRGADIAILGLGLNGHVAFHEPGVPSSFFSGCVELSEVTCHHLQLERGTWGVTYGAGAFMRAKSILMMVSGAGKREILARLIAGDVTIPASALLNHPDFTILADREAMPVTLLRRRDRGIEHDGVA